MRKTLTNMLLGVAVFSGACDVNRKLPAQLPQNMHGINLSATGRVATPQEFYEASWLGDLNGDGVGEKYFVNGTRVFARQEYENDFTDYVIDGKIREGASYTARGGPRVRVRGDGWEMLVPYDGGKRIEVYEVVDVREE